MSQHKATITWNRNSAAFDYQSYPRDHVWSISDVEILASAAPDYLGSESRVDPEQAYVASLASCHMLTFLAIAAKQKMVVESYVDEAVGLLEKNENGKLAITKVILKPQISYAAGSEPDRATLQKMHDSAHRNCFIANSVKTLIEVEF